MGSFIKEKSGKAFSDTVLREDSWDVGEVMQELIIVTYNNTVTKQWNGKFMDYRLFSVPKKKLL